MTRPTLLPALVFAVALSSCGGGGGGVDAQSVERAAQNVQSRCSSTVAARDTAVLRPDVNLLIAQYRAHPTTTFRFEGGQVQTTMRDQLRSTAVTLQVCAPTLARAVQRALRG